MPQVHMVLDPTLRKLVVDLRSDFSRKQLYAALSGVRNSSNDLLLLQKDETAIRCRPVHDMTMAIDNQTLKGAKDFVEGCVRF